MKISNWNRTQRLEESPDRVFYWTHKNDIDRVTIRKHESVEGSIMETKYTVYHINRYQETSGSNWDLLREFGTREDARTYAVEWMRRHQDFQLRDTYDINKYKAQRILERAQILDQGDGFTKEELIQDFEQRYNDDLSKQEFNSLINAGEIFPSGNKRFKVMQ